MTDMRRSILALVLLLSLTSAPAAWAKHFGECISGDCSDGYGTAFDIAIGGNMTGPWRGGDWVPSATYKVEHPKSPGKGYTLHMGADGYPSEGTTFRAGFSKPATFTGTYKKFKNTFNQDTITFVPDKGEYTHPGGLKYTGSFEYVPQRNEHGMFTGGVWIFAGECIDTLADDDEEDRLKPYQGLFVTDETPPGVAMRFIKASPDYLQTIADNYRKSYKAALVDKQNQQRNRQLLGQALSIFSSAMSIAGGGGDLISKIGGSVNAKSLITDLAIDTFKEAVTGEKDIGDAFLGAVGDKLSNLAQNATGTKGTELLAGIKSMRDIASGDKGVTEAVLDTVGSKRR